MTQNEQNTAEQMVTVCTPDKEGMPPKHWLHNLHVQALSLVQKGANKRRFTIHKSAQKSVDDSGQVCNEAPIHPQPVPDKQDSPQQIQEDSSPGPIDPPLPDVVEISARSREGASCERSREEKNQKQSAQGNDIAPSGQDLPSTKQAANTKNSLQNPILAANPSKTVPPSGQTAPAAQDTAAQQQAWQDKIDQLERALQNSFKNNLQQYRQQLSEVSKQLLQLESRLTHLSKSAGVSQGQQAQALHEQHLAQQGMASSSNSWADVTDGLGYVHKQRLKQRFDNFTQE